MYDPNGLFQKLEPLPGALGCFHFFDDEHLALYVPIEPAPKGSARAIPIVDKFGKYRGMRFVPGSGAATQKKMEKEDSAIRIAVAALWKQGFTPYDEGCRLDLDLVFLAPKIRRTERRHTTYPDRDKCLRAVQDMISPPRVDRAPVMNAPHLVTNDSQIHGGYTEKWWLHVWNEMTGLEDEGSGIYIVLRY